MQTVTCHMQGSKLQAERQLESHIQGFGGLLERTKSVWVLEFVDTYEGVAVNINVFGSASPLIITTAQCPNKEKDSSEEAGSFAGRNFAMRNFSNTYTSLGCFRVVFQYPLPADGLSTKATNRHYGD